MELAKDRNSEEGNRGNVNGCTRPSTGNKQQHRKKKRAKLTSKVFHHCVDCVKKERKQSVMWLLNVKCLKISSAPYGSMTGSVVFHWVTQRWHGFPTGTKWYEYTPERVLENDNSKTPCNFSLQTFHKLEQNKLYIIIAGKQREKKIIHNRCSMLI